VSPMKDDHRIVALRWPKADRYPWGEVPMCR
jgi:hypothetical protein